MSAEQPAARDPSRSSWYVDDAFYADLVADFTDFAREDRAVADPAVRDRCSSWCRATRNASTRSRRCC